MTVPILALPQVLKIPELTRIDEPVYMFIGTSCPVLPNALCPLGHYIFNACGRLHRPAADIDRIVIKGKDALGGFDVSDGSFSRQAVVYSNGLPSFLEPGLQASLSKANGIVAGGCVIPPPCSAPFETKESVPTPVPTPIVQGLPCLPSIEELKVWPNPLPRCGSGKASVRLKGCADSLQCRLFSANGAVVAEWGHTGAAEGWNTLRFPERDGLANGYYRLQITAQGPRGKDQASQRLYLLR